jgi:hypothetical protein
MWQRWRKGNKDTVYFEGTSDSTARQLVLVKNAICDHEI